MRGFNSWIVSYGVRSSLPSKTLFGISLKNLPRLIKERKITEVTPLKGPAPTRAGPLVGLKKFPSPISISLPARPPANQIQSDPRRSRISPKRSLRVHALNLPVANFRFGGYFGGFNQTAKSLLQQINSHLIKKPTVRFRTTLD